LLADPRPRAESDAAVCRVRVRGDRISALGTPGRVLTLAGRTEDSLAASVIIPTWNAADVLTDCLRSLERQQVRGGFETIVVDNASTDGSAELLRHVGDEIRVISNKTNVGFSVANNQAAREARGRVLFFLNSDTELPDPDALERLCRAVEAPGVAIAGPVLLNADGTLQQSCASHPGVGRALLISSGMWRLLPKRLLARLAPELSPQSTSRDVDWLMGAALAVRADVFRELGGFWPTMYAEDQDLAYRAQQLGLRVRFESSARVIHLGNHSNAQRWADDERAARVAVAERAFLRAHYGRPRAAAIRTIVGAGYAARALAHALLGRPQRSRVYRAMARVYASRSG
jgi:GT2 family glycosyltransferase